MIRSPTAGLSTEMVQTQTPPSRLSWPVVRVMPTLTAADQALGTALACWALYPEVLTK